MTNQYFIVSVDHPVAKYAADRLQVRVGQDGPDDSIQGYYAIAAGFGCGHTCKTPEAAIRDLFMANGCRNIRIEKE